MLETFRKHPWLGPNMEPNFASVESQTFNKHKRSKRVHLHDGCPSYSDVCHLRHLPTMWQSAQKITLTSVHLHWDRCDLESLEWVWLSLDKMAYKFHHHKPLVCVELNMRRIDIIFNIIYIHWLQKTHACPAKFCDAKIALANSNYKPITTNPPVI